MICSRCGDDKPDKAFPHNYGRRNGATCLDCRRVKYKTRREVARSKVHAVTSPKKKCQRCIKLYMDLGLSPQEAISEAHFVKKGNRIFCEKCFEWASRVPEEFQGW